MNKLWYYGQIVTLEIFRVLSTLSVIHWTCTVFVPFIASLL